MIIRKKIIKEYRLNPNFQKKTVNTNEEIRKALSSLYGHKNKWRFISEIINEFDRYGKTIKIIETPVEANTPDKMIRTTSNFNYDKRNNLVFFTKTEFLHHYQDKYENKYDNNGKLISYEINSFSGTFGKKDNGGLLNIESRIFGECLFEYDIEKRIIKSKLTRYNKDENNHLLNEEITNMIYDDSGEMTNKNIIYNSSDYCNEKTHRYYYDDEGGKVEEIEETSYDNGELIFSEKIFKKKNQNLFLDKNGDIRSKELLFYDENDHLIKKEEYLNFSEEPVRFYEYEYLME